MDHPVASATPGSQRTGLLPVSWEERSCFLPLCTGDPGATIPPCVSSRTGTIEPGGEASRARSWCHTPLVMMQTLPEALSLPLFKVPVTQNLREQ